MPEPKEEAATVVPLRRVNQTRLLEDGRHSGCGLWMLEEPKVHAYVSLQHFGTVGPAVRSGSEDGKKYEY